MKSLFRSVVGAAAIALCSVSHGGVVLGDQVTCSQVNVASSFVCDKSQATVDNNVEFRVGTALDPDLLKVDFFSGLLEIESNLGFFLSSTVLQFTDVTNPFSKVSLTSVSGVTGFTTDDITLLNGVLTINLAGTEWSARGDKISISLPHERNDVPEPSPMALVSAALVGVLAVSRRRKRAS